MDLFEAALKRVEAEVPNLWTSEGLGRVLRNCMNADQDFSRELIDVECIKDPSVYWGLAGIAHEGAATLRRIAADPIGWTQDSHSEEIRAGGEWYAGMGSVLGAESLQTILLYHQIRDNLQEAQRRKGISGLNMTQEWKLFGKSIAVPASDWQLYVMPFDLPVLRAGAQQVFELLTLQMPRHLERYDLLEDMSDDGDGDWQSCSFDEILSLKDRVTACRVTPECRDWVPHGERAWRAVSCDREPDCDPDEIRIQIGLDDLIVGSGDAVRYRSFLFEHKDKSRFPWRGKSK